MADQDFIINAGPQGTFRASGNYQTTPEQVDALFANIRAQKPGKITLYFHGGLVSEKAGMDTARKLYQPLKDTGGFPIFMVWETGLVETISTNIKKLSETSLYDKILKALLKVLEKKLGIETPGGRGAGDVLTDVELNRELSKARPFEDADVANQDGARSAVLIEELPEDDAMLEMQFYPELQYILDTDTELPALLADSSAVQGRGIISSGALLLNLTKIAVRVAKRFLNKRDHGFYPTVVEEILRQFYLAELGAWVWNEMKLKSEYLWKDNQGLEGTDQHAGRYVLDRLVAYIQETKDAAGKPTVWVDLVGHSAGSIVVCNLLKAMASDFSGFKFRNLVFMAPACRTDLFVAEVLTHPERYEALRCFTMSDENERKDMLVPYFYTRSLLYLISGILEKKGEGFDEYILGMERYLSGESPYKDDENLALLKTYFAEQGKNRLVLSKSAADAQEGLRTTSLSHGGFDDDLPTIESVCCILKG